MTVANWVRWNRTELDLAERAALLGVLTPEQRHNLLHNDYVWRERRGVIWQPREGGLRHARYTHSADFETRFGAFRIDAEGQVRATDASPHGDGSTDPQ